MDDFIKASQLFGKNIICVQGAGGNASVKIRNKMYIKASGYLLKNVSKNRDYACIKYKPIADYLFNKKKYNSKDENTFLKFVASQMILTETYGMPSMETAFHTAIHSKYVFHLHSVYANIFCCMRYGSRYLEQICKTIPHTIVDYMNPGYELAFHLSQRQTLPPLIFLKNHGLIIHGESVETCVNIVTKLHTLIERYLQDKNVFVPFHIATLYKPIKQYSFPDSAVFAHVNAHNAPEHKYKELLEISSAQHYIDATIKRLGKNPVYLNKKAVERLLNMKQEKHRQEIFRT